jgi:hypothetical protein
MQMRPDRGRRGDQEEDAEPIGGDRLGNNTESLTLIAGGPHGGSVAMIDGYDVIAVPIHPAHGSPTRLFGIEKLKPDAFASGIVHVRSERRFYFGLQGQVDQLWSTDEAGAPQAPRPITFLPGFDPATIQSVEGMTLVPGKGATPDRIARALYVGAPGSEGARIEILSLTGGVERQVRLGPPLDGPDSYVLGLAFDPPDTFVVTSEDASLWRVSLDGEVLEGPFTSSELPMLEGLTRLGNGRFVCASYAAGKLFGLDANLGRMPALDRSAEIGIGLSRPFDGVWDPATGTFALIGMRRDLRDVIASVPASLATTRTITVLDGPRHGIARLPDEDLFAVGRVVPPYGIDLLARNGSQQGEIVFGNVAELPRRRVAALAYIPSTGQFVVGLRRLPGTAWLISRTGKLEGTFELPAAGGVLQYLDEGGQGRLGFWSPPTLYTLDLSGAVVDTRTPGIDGLVHPMGYVAAPGGGALLIDPNDSHAVLRAA